MKMQKNTQQFNMWDDVDMDNLGLDRFGIEVNTEPIQDNVAVKPEPELGPGTGRKAGKRIFLCCKDDWEERCIYNQSEANQERLLKKYGGIWFWDDGVKYTIHPRILEWWYTDKKYTFRGCKDGYNWNDDDDSENQNHMLSFEIDNDMLGTIWTSHDERRYDDGKDGSMEYDEFHLVEMRGTVNPKTREWLLWMKDEDQKPAAKPPAKKTADKNKRKKFIESESDDSDEDKKPPAKQTAARKPTKKKPKKK
jgi:hypothetical protein